MEITNICFTFRHVKVKVPPPPSSHPPMARKDQSVTKKELKVK
jgi:hypothetical protein